ILMLSASTDPGDSKSAFAAIRLGALDVMEKPVGVVTEAFSAIAAKLTAKVKSLSRIRVIHHYRPHRAPVAPLPLELPVGERKVLAIGASTGGPKAVLQLLQSLPKDFKAAVLVVQHISDGFAPGFADWLNRETALPVRLASQGEELHQGVVQIAPTGYHLKVEAGRVVLDQSPPVHNCRPAVDVFFQSLVTQELAPETVALLLTGMGSDGADGLVALRQGGAHTIAQDEASCAVFGMPKVAIERDGASQVLALEQIPQIIHRLFES
ncbi:MAG: chemotaxis response regulator protein-glutamate methylesterase, partial [Desulfuromonadales bacterium]|nr:chemotaxis response regulator protein-glutamate methylesterase [Desulfuromonadales bacterium]